MIVLKTNYGDICVELDFEKAPVSANNFMAYVKKGFYDNTIFHRVIDNFMIQGGGFEADMTQKPTDGQIENEADNGLKNEIGTLAMARTSDPHSATCQFFINVSNNTFLDHKNKTNQGWGYAVFGKVTDGMDIINKIKQCKTTSKGGHQDVPVDEIVIISATIKADTDAAKPATE